MREEFYFSMGTVLVIFSFFWTDNDLVCAPPPSVPPGAVSPYQYYTHTLAHISKTTRTIILKLWEVVPNIVRVTNLDEHKNMTFGHFHVGDPLGDE